MRLRLCVATAGSSRAEVLVNATGSFQGDVARRVRKATERYPIAVTKLRIQRAAKCRRKPQP